MYESVIDLVVGEATMLFVELHYTLATEEAERIGVDHVARMSSNDSGESSLGKLLVRYSLNRSQAVKRVGAQSGDASFCCWKINEKVERVNIL